MLPALCLLTACSADPDANAAMHQTVQSSIHSLSNASQVIAPAYFQSRVGMEQAKNGSAQEPQNGGAPTTTNGYPPAAYQPAGTPYPSYAAQANPYANTGAP